MRIEAIDEAVTCPGCRRTGRLKGALTVSKLSGDWMTFAPDAVPSGFQLVISGSIRLACGCGAQVWPARSEA
jgi:hypothetical protein